MSMQNCNCCYKCSCTAVAIVAAILLGIVAAFLQITGVITVTAAFLWVVLGIAVVYLGVLVITGAVARDESRLRCLCDSLNTLLVGILGTVLFSLVLLAVGIVATSVVSAILVGLLVAFFFLIILATACYVRYLAGCSSRCNS